MDSADYDIRKGQFLPHETLLKASLHYTATVFIRANLVAIVHAGAVYELCVGGVLLGPWQVRLFWFITGLEGQKEGLDHVVTIWVRGKIEDALGHFCANSQDFAMKSGRLGTQYFNQSLNAARSVQIH